MSRKNGCPMSVRDWSVEIRSRASTAEAPDWLPVRGLDSIELSLQAETRDASGAESLWGEPYVTKRTGKLTIEGRPIADTASGEADPGQAELNCYAALGGCGGDACLRLADPYGRARILDAVVTAAETGSDEDGETISWELEIVGEPAEERYVQLTGIAAEPASLTLAQGESAQIAVHFTPENASNRRYSAYSTDPAKLRVSGVGPGGFTVTAVAACSPRNTGPLFAAPIIPALSHPPDPAASAILPDTHRRQERNPHARLTLSPGTCFSY